MGKPVIHQIVAGFRHGDAISDEAILLRKLFRSHGYDSDIFCEVHSTAKEVRHDARNIESLETLVLPHDTVILHLSIGSRANVIFPALNCRRVILYHNVTPAEYFERLNPPIAQRLAEGRSQVAALFNAADINLADSIYNATELELMGYKDVKVFPLVTESDSGKRSIDSQMYARFSDDKYVNILFVGRVVPNKRHDKLIQVFHHFQHYVERNSRLIIAGSSNGLEAYKSLLLGSVHALELKRVVFTEFISAEALNACYASASAFLCMSDHEGFCAPLLEAMSWEVPVFAKASAAVPETLGGAGVLFDEVCSPAEIAETIGAVLKDSLLKSSIIEAQNKRLERYHERDVWSELEEIMAYG